MGFNNLWWALALMMASVFAGCKTEEDLYIKDSGILVPKTVDEDSTLPSINLNGTRLHSKAFGNPSDPMLLLVHGGPGSDSRYLLNCIQFASEGYYVIFYDQRGSGLSKRHSKNEYSIQVMLEDLKGVIQYYRTSPDQKLFIFGHSWGGMLATAYINNYPLDVDGLILAEPGGFTWNMIEDYLSRLYPSNYFGEDLNNVTYPDHFITGKEDDHAILDYKFMVMSAADYSENSMTGEVGDPVFWRYGAVVSDALMEIGRRDGFDWTTNLQDFKTKVMFIYSERNKAYGELHAKKVSAAFPNVELFQVKGAGHDMISPAPGWSNFYPKALDYLNSLK